MKDFAPKKFGKYQLLQKIAVGGMAELYRAKVTRAHGFEKLVAIKKILPHLIDQGNLVKAFIDEARLAAFLQHENIVQIYDFGSIDGEYFIAMEYLSGKDLRKLTDKAGKTAVPLGLENTLYIISQICAGLDYSHNLKDLQGRPLNIIHRDINPQNIFLTYEGQVKIIDFGIAKAASHNSTTHEGLIKGKLAYMSPEQATGKTIDHRSDIFSTGIIFYELLAGRRMFEGETMQVYSQVREARYEPLDKLVPDLPAKMNAVVEGALAKNPDQRYQTCGEMLADLEECIFDLPARTNGRRFATFVKEFFREELAVEENTLWEKTQVYSDERSDRGSLPLSDDETHGSTVFLNAPGKWELFRHHIWRFIPVGAMIILGLVFNLSLTELSFTPSDRSVAAYSIDLPPPPVDTIADQIEAARNALEAKQFSSAVALFETVLADDKSAIKRFSDSYVEALKGLAEERISTDRDFAKELLLKALDIKPASEPVLSKLGFIYLDDKNYPQAIETYQKVTEIEPRLPNAFFNLGYIYAITEDYARAREMYARVVRMEPDFLDEALFNLAMVQEQLGEHSQCLKSLKQAIEINPGNAPAMAYLNQITQQKE
ncbi:MAG: protein kinase [Deltaproteobacteria bacterium]|jgi:serine/threonine protein kinase/Flp pilus assembly protein TadD